MPTQRNTSSPGASGRESHGNASLGWQEENWTCSTTRQALDDLRSPPGNRLEALAGNLRGMYSVRVNDRWRVLFRWGDNGPEQVRVVDYH